MRYEELEINDGDIKQQISYILDFSQTEITENMVRVFRSGWNRGASHAIRCCLRDLKGREEAITS